jgi:phosphatidylglycerophosphate synthase
MSFGRVLLGAFVFTELNAHGESLLVLPAVLLACFLDYSDGRVARANGADSTKGRLIDNLCDAAFLALCFWAFARIDLWSHPLVGSATKYWEHANWLPLIMLGASFGAYMVRWAASARAGMEPAPSMRGHSAGVFNYVLAVLGGAAVLPGFTMTPWILEPGFVTVALLNATAVSENLLLLAAVYRRT